MCLCGFCLFHKRLAFSGCRKNLVYALLLGTRAMLLASRAGFRRPGWIWPWWTIPMKQIFFSLFLRGLFRYIKIDDSAWRLCPLLTRVWDSDGLLWFPKLLFDSCRFTSLLFIRIQLLLECKYSLDEQQQVNHYSLGAPPVCTLHQMSEVLLSHSSTDRGLSPRAAPRAVKAKIQHSTRSGQEKHST